ncbi:MAG TPA: type II secretion system protein M [Burkholderiaceae bacterium]|jgi:general secretion pathway protein M|nr:type II secretion system protein M [Burkholderiaceae bacterium]
MNLETLRQFWSEREPRERLAIAAGLLFAVVVLLYLMIEPAYSSISRLKRSLPSARAQSAQLQALLGEVHALKSRPAVAAAAATDAPTAIQKSLAAAGLKAARVVPLANGALQLTFANVPYAAWSVWLATAERELGLRATAVTVKATATAGNADVDLALRSGRE